MLNEKFKADTGRLTKTIVLIDEYDEPFRNCERSDDDELLTELNHLFELGNKNGTGISLLLLCGLTRMAGFGVSNLLDVSKMTAYHGLCGISSNELAMLCTNNQLEDPVVVDSGLGGFRFGFDKVRKVKSNAALESDLFSLSDAWEIIRSVVVDDNRKPISRQYDMESAFGFAVVAESLISSEESFTDLVDTLGEEWVNPWDASFVLTREQYLLLDSKLRARKVFFELGLLTVKATDDDNNLIKLGPPNEFVKGVAMKWLEDKRMKWLEDKRKQGEKCKVLESSKIDGKSVFRIYARANMKSDV
jgi:hypothetical protein